MIFRNCILILAIFFIIQGGSAVVDHLYNPNSSHVVHIPEFIVEMLLFTVIFTYGRVEKEKHMAFEKKKIQGVLLPGRFYFYFVTYLVCSIVASVMVHTLFHNEFTTTIPVSTYFLTALFLGCIYGCLRYVFLKRKDIVKPSK